MAALATQRFRQALKYSHNVVHRMDAELSGAKYSVDYLGGQVTQSYDDTSRWSLDAELLVPSSFSTDGFKSFLNTRTTTLQPWRGLKFDDGTTELLKFAKFYITDVVVSEDSNGAPTMRVQGIDRSCRAQGDLGTNVNILAGTSPTVAVPKLLDLKIPHARYSLADSPFKSPTLLITTEMDGWDEATRLMTSIGQNLYFDREDRCVSGVRALVPSSDYVWHFDENNLPDFRNLQRHESNDLFPNVIRVVSTNPGTPGIVGEAADMNPASKTYRYGDYGEQVRSFNSEQVTTTAQATAMAQYLLSKLLGPQDEITFDAIPNPILDAGDTILVTRAIDGLVATPLLVVQIRMPLTVLEPMTVVARPSLFNNAVTAPAR